MKTLLKITLDHNKEAREISLGIPDTQEEMKQMYQLRYDVYVDEKKYIPATLEQDAERLDIDKHDINNSCIYFVAYVDNMLIGTARLILEDRLPTEKDYFEFKEPNAISKIPRENRAEVGRIISRPYGKYKIDIPRNLTMLGLFFVMVQEGERRNILGGYGALKLYIFKKLKKLGVPFHRIKNYRLIYDGTTMDDPLTNFFTEEDPVVPVYFKSEEVSGYVNKVFNSKSLFEKIEEGRYHFKGQKISLLDALKLKIKT